MRGKRPGLDEQLVDQGGLAIGALLRCGTKSWDFTILSAFITKNIC